MEKGEQIEKNLDSVEVKIHTLKSQITKLQEELADAEKQREELTQSFDSLMAESVTVRNRSERLYLE